MTWPEMTGKENIAVTIAGNSIEPKLASGDLAIVRKKKDVSLINYGKGHMVVTDKQIFCKIIRKSRNDEEI